jgi:hypothetical protein
MTAGVLALAETAATVGSAGSAGTDQVRSDKRSRSRAPRRQQATHRFQDVSFARVIATRFRESKLPDVFMTVCGSGRADPIQSFAMARLLRLHTAQVAKAASGTPKARSTRVRWYGRWVP